MGAALLKFRKVRAGLYACDEGFEVERDAQAYVRQADADGDGLLAGCQDDGWSLALGDNVLDWFDTKREAVAEANRLAARMS